MKRSVALFFSGSADWGRVILSNIYVFLHQFMEK